MAVPFRRTSKTKKRMRRTHFKLAAKGLVKCPNCGEMIQSHRVCPSCGFYDGKQVISKKVGKEVVEEKATKKAKPDKKVADSDKAK